MNLGARLCSAAAPGQILIRSELLEDLASVSVKEKLSLSFKGVSDEMDIADISLAEGELKQ